MMFDVLISTKVTRSEGKKETPPLHPPPRRGPAWPTWRPQVAVLSLFSECVGLLCPSGLFRENENLVRSFAAPHKAPHHLPLRSPSPRQTKRRPPSTHPPHPSTSSPTPLLLIPFHPYHRSPSSSTPTHHPPTPRSPTLPSPLSRRASKTPEISA